VIALEAATHVSPLLPSARRSFLHTLTAAGAAWRFLLLLPVPRRLFRATACTHPLTA
jgi:hypothetical protein